MKGNNNPPTTQTGRDIGIDRLMELDPGPIEDDDSFDRGNPENCATGTMCHDLVSSQLVLSDHLISAFQQRHQACHHVKLNKDNTTSALGNTYHSISPLVPICLDHTFAQYPNLCLHRTLIDCFQAMPSSSKHLAMIWGDIISMMSLPMRTDLGLSTNESDFDT
jgi:hypothetical protein